MIGFSVGLARSATWSAAIVEVARSRVVDGIGTSSTSPLEVSLVCRRKWLADPNDDGLARSVTGERVTFETSWLDGEVRGSLRALLTHRRLVRDPDLVGAWGAGGSGIDLFLEAGAGEAVWL
jgi:hypothetical protein